MAVLTTLADAVTAELNATSRTWSGRFSAERMNVPILKREQAKYISGIVTPISRTTTKLNRGVIQDVCVLQIGIQQTLQDGDNDETDVLIALGEEIQAYFDQGLGLAAMPAASCEDTSFGANDENPWLSVRDIEGLMLYTGVIGLTFRVMR